MEPAQSKKKLSESQEQIMLFNALEQLGHPYDLAFHIPNGGKRDKITAAQMKREGVKAGVPDIFLPVSRGGYHGLFIEMKIKGGRLGAKQKIWLDHLEKCNYKCIVCYSAQEALKEIKGYVKS